MDKKIYEKIIAKKEFSHLPKKDVERAFEHFKKRQVSEEEKIRLTRDLLRKIFSAFLSKKILSSKNKNVEWILRKHISTRERLPYYKKLYKKLLKDFEKPTIIDLGAGINGFSCKFFGKNINYVGIEGIGQLTELTNNYFKREKINGKVLHLSLFDLGKIKKIIKETKKPRIIFLFKALDSLEMLERDYSKKLLSSIMPLVDRVVISFATRSLIKKTKFKIKRTWFIDFIKDNFKIIDDFELGAEIYIVLESD